MIGEKIKQKRIELNMSMQQLANEANLSIGFISQVERELTEPSITSLRKIAKALDVAVFSFLLEETKENRVVKKNDRKSLKFPNSHLEYDLLSPNLNRQMEMFMGHLQPGAKTCDTPLSHPGEEVIHVLKGTMWIKVGEDEYTLQEGDTIYYTSSIPHTIINTGQKKLVFISTITPPRF